MYLCGIIYIYIYKLYNIIYEQNLENYLFQELIILKKLNIKSF